MLKNFSRQVKTTLAKGYLSSTAAGSTWGAKLDMKDFDGCRVALLLGTTAGSTGTVTFSVIGTNTSTAATTSYSTLNGASISVAATTAGTAGKFASIDLWTSKYRYLKPKIVRTGKVIVHGILAEQYGPKYLPVTAGTSTLANGSTNSDKLCVGAT